MHYQSAMTERGAEDEPSTLMQAGFPPKPMSVPSAVTPRAVLTNPDHVRDILQLSSLLHSDVSLAITITPPALPACKPVQVTIMPHKHTDYFQLPVLSVGDQWAERHYSSVEKASQLWVAFYHLIEERGASRIFGRAYADVSSLFRKVAALHADYTSGNPITLFFPHLFVADEFSCDYSPGYTLPLAFEALRQLSNRCGYALHLASLRTVDSPAGRPDQRDDYEGVCEPVDTAFGPAHIREYKLACYKIVFTSLVDESIRKHLATLLQTVSKPPTPLPEHHFMDVFLMSVSVSDLQPLIFSEMDGRALEYYQRLASVVWKTIANLAWSQVLKLGFAPHVFLKTLYDFFGPAIAQRIAAVGCVGTRDTGRCQIGVKDISFSPFVCDDGHPLALKYDKISLATPADVLRDVGRLTLNSNLIRPPDGPQEEAAQCRVTSTRPDGVVVTVPHTPDKTVPGLLPSSTTIH